LSFRSHFLTYREASGDRINPPNDPVAPAIAYASGFHAFAVRSLAHATGSIAMYFIARWLAKEADEGTMQADRNDSVPIE